MAIYFYTTTDKYGGFSNFSRHGITLDRKYWPTVEHFFQAQKFLDLEHQNRIAKARTPKEAKQLGWDRSIPIRDDWDEIRDEIMRKAVLKKFETHKELKEMLLGTGDEEL